MQIKGKVHCFFEQSGTFKNEFIKLGIPAEDYDIQNNFGETDHIIDLFAEIEKAYGGGISAFDDITEDDLIIAFFPCIHFNDAKTLIFKGLHIGQKNKPLKTIMKKNIDYSQKRQYFYEILMKLVFITEEKNLRLIIENPYNSSGMTFLENNFINPTIIDKNRMLRGDYFIKPTAYWFINCDATNGFTYQNDKEQKIIMKTRGANKAGLCSEERSMISPDYARNFICDFILGKTQEIGQLKLFKEAI